VACARIGHAGGQVEQNTVADRHAETTARRPDPIQVLRTADVSGKKPGTAVLLVPPPLRPDPSKSVSMPTTQFVTCQLQPNCPPPDFRKIKI
jgi:hypothetical protein